MARKAPNPDKRPRSYSPNISNKKARFEYELLEKLETGIVLVGTEVKSLRRGTASLDESFCRIRDGQLYLIGCTIPIYEYGNLINHEPGRVRKLLVHRRELNKLQSKVTQKGLTLVPLRIYFNDRGLAKVQLAIAKGKTHSDKRAKLRDRQIDRDMKSQLRRRR